MRAALLLLVVCLAATSAQGKMEIKRRQVDVHREIRARQILGGPGDAGTQQESGAASGAGAAAPVAATTPVVASPVSPTPATEAQDPTTTSQPLNPLTGLFPAPSRQTTAGQVTEDDSPPAVVSSALAAATSATLRLSSDSEIDALASSTTRSVPTSAATESDEDSVDVINVTSTALIAASLSSVSSASVASASASKAAEKEDNEVGGLNKTSLIAIIAIASGVGLIAAVWTIFRKWKLSPSRQFEDKLTPIDWSPEMAGAHRSEDKLALTRSNSDGSSVNKSGSALGRRNSYGSANGSQFGSRTDMAEIPYNNALPAYPPPASDYGYGYNTQPRSASPYEHLQRQPTGFTNGGRYGEGYRNNY